MIVSGAWRSMCLRRGYCWRVPDQFANAVPEPSTLVMLGTAVAAIAGVLRRKLSAQRLRKMDGTGASYQGGLRA